MDLALHLCLAPMGKKGYGEGHGKSPIESAELREVMDLAIQVLSQWDKNT